MKVTKAVTDNLPLSRKSAEPVKENTESQAKVDALKQLDTNKDGKLDRTEFSKSVHYQSADERQRDALSRAFAAAASKSGRIDTEKGFEALARTIDEAPSQSERPADSKKGFFEKGLDGLAAAYDTVKGFVGNLFSDMKKGLSDFISWTGEQLDKVTNGFFEQFQTEVVRKPEEIEASSARSRLRETDDAEREAVEKLTPKEREAFETVASQLESDPVTQLTLRNLLLDGRLPGGNDLVDGKSLLANLAELSTQPLADGISRQALLADVLSQVDDPITISQKQQNTCGPTTAQLILAMQEPAEYVRVAAGLASPEGTVRLQNGDTIKREPDWNDAQEDRRTVSNRLFQSALMEYANGLFDYRNIDDGRQVKVGPIDVTIPGMIPPEMIKLVEGLTGRDHGVDYSIMSDQVSKTFTNALEKAGPGNEVPILVNYNIDGSGVQSLSPHYLLVTGYDAESGLVSITNPWGREEQVALGELQRHLIAAMPQASRPGPGRG